MDKVSAEQLAAALGDSTVVVLVTAGGVVVQRQTDAEKTIVQFADMDPEAAAALRAVTLHCLGLHETKRTDAARSVRALQVADFVAEAAASGALTPADVANAKAMVLKLGIDVDAIEAEKAAAAAAAQAIKDAEADAARARAAELAAPAPADVAVTP